jgi:hypothetical protein
MQRKKQLYGANDWSETSTSGWNYEKDQIQKSGNSSVKKVAKSYLNYNPTFYQNLQTP